MVRNCPEAAPVSYVQRGGGTAFYNIPDVTPAVDFRLQSRPSKLGAFAREIDTKEVVLGDDNLPLPLHYALAQTYVEKEVFEVDKKSIKKPTQVGCLWSLTSTVKGQQLLTVWDTGAAVAVVPRSTIVQTGTEWVQKSDIDFVMADGARHTPLGYAPQFVFRIGDLYFVLKVYVVESANYQLLLGNSFMYDVGAGLFPKWQRVILTSPVKLELQATLDPIRRDTCAPLQNEAVAASVVVHRLNSSASYNPRVAEIRGSRIEEVQDEDIVELENPVVVTYIGGAGTCVTSGLTPASTREQILTVASKMARASTPKRNATPVLYATVAPGFTPAPAPEQLATPMLHINAASSAYRLGVKDLVGEVENKIVDVDRSVPVLTREFVGSCIEFGPDVPPAMREAVCQDIIDYSHAFSWNAFDLGCISDVPH